MPVRRALVSVYDKHGVVDFCRGLAELGVTLLSTGGTARLLVEHGLEVTEVSAWTGAPEILGGRVKTLHPRIHGGLLARRGQDEAEMRQHGIEPIDLVVVNLYPFEETTARAGCTLEQAVEALDIGGPAMLRAAAKNHAAVGVVADPGDYGRVLKALHDNGGSLGAALRLELAGRAFARTAEYDGAISNFFGSCLPAQGSDVFPPTLTLHFHKLHDLRYGENPHQAAALYGPAEPPTGTVAGARLLAGKALSFNNLIDVHTAWRCVSTFTEPACVIVKHANPCGAAQADSLSAAYRSAYAGDPVSAFGGVIACNRRLDEAIVRTIVERQFVEVLAAPGLAEGVVAAVADKPDLRLLSLGEAANERREAALDLRSMGGGLLVQDDDLPAAPPRDARVATRRAPSAQEHADLSFAWRIVKYVKSNAIVLARDGRTVGIGMGQPSRVDSVRHALEKAAAAGLAVEGAVMASDAFFPFADGVELAAEAGVAAVMQPGGSRRDAEVIEAAERHQVAMVLTGVRHFRH